MFNNLSRTEKEVLNKIIPLFENDKLVSIIELIDITKKNSANLRKYLRKFEKLDIIEVVGERKARKYRLKKF